MTESDQLPLFSGEKQVPVLSGPEHKSARYEKMS